MNARKMLCSIFAACTLGAVPALAQEAPAQTPAPAPVTATTAPDIDGFNVRDYFLKDESGVTLDSRKPMYLCGDDTQDCWTAAQREAWAVREFRLMMESTVYSCMGRPGNEDLPQHYNTFITNNQTTLQDNFHTVAAFYTSRTETAREAMLAQEKLETATGNIYSGAAVQDGYCEKAGGVLRHVAGLDSDREMVAVAHRLLLRPAA
jgi:hypothetical protein